ncbi:uncharacterized protein [Argopecten irradians]|uniref:uncharacterized protein n=1 Tax=Argopecten irradians TaxID=31199 RepID=UPI00371731B2
MGTLMVSLLIGFASMPLVVGDPTWHHEIINSKKMIGCVVYQKADNLTSFTVSNGKDHCKTLEDKCKDMALIGKFRAAKRFAKEFEKISEQHEDLKHTTSFLTGVILDGGCENCLLVKHNGKFVAAKAGESLSGDVGIICAKYKQKED